MSGYNPLHIQGHNVPLLEITNPELKKSALQNPKNKNNPIEFQYTRSSQIHHATRKFAILMAYHLYDRKAHKLKRLKRFGFCPQIGMEYQFGEVLYGRNDIDRSHIRDNFSTQFVPENQAIRDQYESFYYSNMYPMSNKVHHTVWGKMNKVAIANIGKGKIGKHGQANVYKGIIFRASDGFYERNGTSIQVPTGFWQAWFYIKDGRPCFVCYLLEDDPRYYQLSASVSKDPAVYLIKAAELQALSGLSFQGLEEFDLFKKKVVSTSSTRAVIENQAQLVF